MTLNQAINMVRNSPLLVGSTKLCEAVQLVLVALAERENAHEAWEWWAKHPVPIERLNILGEGISWRCGCVTKWEDSQLAAVLAAKAAKEES